jgi:hypothetical protein
MSKIAVGLTLGVSAIALAALGAKKYSEVQSLRSLKVKPAKPAFQFIHINGESVDGLLNLEVSNPTQNQYRIQNIEAVIHLVDVSGNPGAYLASVRSFSTVINPGPSGISIPVNFSLKQLIQLATNIFSTRSATIKLTGQAIYLVNGVSVPVPFSFAIDIREQLNQFFKQQNIPLTL